MIMNEIWDSFKAVSYGLNHMGAAVYIDLAKPGFNFLPVAFGKPLIFSGVTIQMAPSTINDAEDIVSKILKQEGIKITDRDFYDLQTWKSYHGFKKGEFILSKLHFRKAREIRVKSWEEIKDIPPNFCQIFYCLLNEAHCFNISRQG